MSDFYPNIATLKEQHDIDLTDEAVRQNLLFLWGNCYLDEDICKNGDPHQSYADLLGVPRNVAKEICYIIHYVSESYASKLIKSGTL